MVGWVHMRHTHENPKTLGIDDTLQSRGSGRRAARHITQALYARRRLEQGQQRGHLWSHVAFGHEEGAVVG
jgi:hypothetical protein